MDCEHGVKQKLETALLWSLIMHLFLTKIFGNVASNQNSSVVDIFVSNNGCLPLRRCEDTKFLRDVFVLGYQCAMNVTLSQNGSAQKKSVRSVTLPKIIYKTENV